MTRSPHQRLWNLLGLDDRARELAEDKSIRYPWDADSATPPCSASGCVVDQAAQRTATAHHEAAHAVARALLGFRFEHVTIVADDDSWGHVRLVDSHLEPDDPSAFEREDVLVHGAAWFAGMVAESRYAVRLGGPGPAECARCVWEQNLKGDSGRPKAVEADQQFYNDAWMAANTIVDQHEAVIGEVAEALLRRGTLDEADVLNLCGFR